MSREGDISTIFLVLRRLRRPLITLIVIFSIGVLGLTLVPGPVGDDGETTRISFFHAFYFISFTATTIGFGEIPETFSEQQRLWVIFCIYLSVVGWAIFITALLRLSQDDNLRKAILNSQFGREVRNLQEPFYLVCGYGETGHRICTALDRLGLRAVVVEIDASQLADIEHQRYRSDVPGLVADAANPEKLRLAGLTHRYCRGVIALTNDDAANLAVAISARLLAPNLPVLARAETRDTAANMLSFNTQHVINPFQKFGDYLSLAMHSPAAYHLLVWLTGLPGTTIIRHRDPPRGHWILCGFGNFGRSLAEAIAREGLQVTVIDLLPERQAEPHDAGFHWIRGDGTGAATLTEAGIENAAGIIAATASDVDNLSIAVTARQLNGKAFVVLRQNSVINRPLIEAFEADITMVPSEVVAQECLAILTTPLLAPFLDALHGADEAWCSDLLDQLSERFGEQVPEVWSIRLNLAETPALYRLLMQGQTIKLCDIFRDPAQRASTLNCQALQLDRDDDDRLLLPGCETALRPGDELLLVGDRSAHRDLELSLSNEHTLLYVLTGKDLPGGWVWERLSALRN